MALLIAVAVVCIGVAVSYPIRYKMELDSNNSELEGLSSMRRRVMEEHNIGEDDFEDRPRELPWEVPGEETPSAEPAATGEAPSETAPARTGEAAVDVPGQTPQAEATDIVLTPTPQAEATDIVLTPTPRAEATDIVLTPTPLVEATDIILTPTPRAEATDIVLTPTLRAEATDIVLTPTPATEAGPTPTVVAGETEEPAPTQTVEAGGTPQPTAAQTGEADGTPEPTAAQTGEAVRTAQPTGEASTATPVPKPTPGLFELMLNNVIVPTDTPAASSTPVPVTPSPSPTPDRSARDDPDTYKAKEKVKLDKSKILPELKDIYELNHDLVGWLYIDDTNIDYPVVQNPEDRTFYLTHDFYGKSNANGQIIMEDKCDPWTPSYNLVLSGHHMNSGAMFGKLGQYKDKAYWETHKIVEFDTLMARKRYVVFAAFYSADYNENEKGFRYSADIQYKMDADLWLGEIQANQIYETGIETEFGDEFITLTTCDHTRRSIGRFVVVARRIREGERIQ